MLNLRQCHSCPISLFRWIGLILSSLFLLCPTMVHSRIGCPNSTEARRPWLVVSGNIEGPIRLSCVDPEFYPFCDLKYNYRMSWKLPSSLGSSNVAFNQPNQIPGIQVLQNGQTLEIDRSLLSAGADFSGIYECTVLAKHADNDTLASWFYLRWAVDIFTMESMLLNATPVVKYRRNIIGSIVAPVLILVVAAVFKVAVYIHNRKHKSHERVTNDDTTTTTADNNNNNNSAPLNVYRFKSPNAYYVTNGSEMYNRTNNIPLEEYDGSKLGKSYSVRSYD